MHNYRLDLIGTFGLFAPDGRRIEITSKKSIALLALVASAPNGERSRKWLQAMLWSGSEEGHAQSSLRRELSTLAKVLDRQGAGDLLQRTTQRVSLTLDHMDIDIFGIGARMAQGRQPISRDFLEGLDLRDCDAFEDWLREERDRVHELLSLYMPPPLPGPSSLEIVGSDLTTAPADPAEGLPMPPKPSLAVLPFAELNPQGGWLGAGIADEIGVTLSHFPQLFIVASASARALAEQGLDRRDIARRLGVRYLLDGTVTRADQGLRASVSLIDGASGEQVWAETFIGTMADLFELQKSVAMRIAPQIWSNVDLAERRIGLRLTGPRRGKYDRYWRANALFRSWRQDDVNEAIELAEDMVAEDPNCAWSASLAGYCHSITYLLGYAKDGEKARAAAARHYQTAVRLGEHNVEALGYAAGILLNIGGDLGAADRLIAHALALLPAHQPTLFWGGWIDIMQGNTQRARQRLNLARRINPASGVMAQILCGIGFTHLLEAEPDLALRHFAEACETGPEFILTQLGLAAAAGLGSAAEGLNGHALPSASGANASRLIALFKRQEDRDLLIQGLSSPRLPA